MDLLGSYVREDEARRRRFRRALAVRLTLWPLLFAVALSLFLRRYESVVTWHPVHYDGGARWRLPDGAEDVWFETADGVRLHGWFVRARTAAPSATILYAHGNTGNVSYLGGLAAALAERGFDVLVFDYRGYGRSAGAVTDERALYADADAAYDFLTRARGVDPRRLVLYGQSLGTTAVVDVAARRPAGALVVESGLSSASAMAGAVLPWLPRPFHWLSRNRFDSEGKMPRVACPVLFAHGDPDPVVPAAQGRALYDAARGPKRLVVLPGAGHNVAGSCGARYFDAVAAFVRAALDAPQTVSGAEVNPALCAP
ncbi:MAG TPA: alpha/beta hydrolase [Pyrinomonadaceae bacterium]|jgi:hypothetical protein